MIIIAVSSKTNKTIPKLICGKWKHVAPIIINKDQLTLYQFTRPYRRVTPIKLQWRDIRILEQHGWQFITTPYSPPRVDIGQIRAVTCVEFTKRTIGIKDFSIQTPNQMVKKLSKYKTAI